MQSCHIQWQVSFVCPYFFVFFSWNWLRPVDCVLSLLSVHAMGHDYLAVQIGIVWVTPGGGLNKKDGLTRYGDSHVKDKTS